VSKTHLNSVKLRLLASSEANRAKSHGHRTGSTRKFCVGSHGFPLTSSHSSSIKGKLPPRSLNPYLPSFINNSPLHPLSHIKPVEMASRIAPKFAQMAARPAAFRAVQPKVAQRAFSGKSSPPQRHLITPPSKHRTILCLHHRFIHQ
jgi:hypothetical protein